MDYSKAKELDKRTILEIYWSFLKREHSIIFTFVTKDDYNITMIKYSRFVFLLCTNMAMNVFFFSDETMNKLFLDYGKYNFIQQIPQIVYSTIVSKLIETILCFLSMTDKCIYEIKSLKPSKQNKNLASDIFKTIRRKLFFYFFITFISFLGYWYIVVVFCAVYENTQIAYIKDSFTSSLLGILLPFILYTFPASFRICSLKCKNNSCLYKVSELLPFF